MRSEEDQEGAEGREIIIRLYCMKKIIFNIIIIMQKLQHLDMQSAKNYNSNKGTVKF